LILIPMLAKEERIGGRLITLPVEDFKALEEL
jgi:hypothetical protein